MNHDHEKKIEDKCYKAKKKKKKKKPRQGRKQIE